MYKKYLACLLLCSLFLWFSPPAANTYAAANYIVNVNGVTASWNEIGPFMRGGRLMVPLGGFGSALGAEIKWEENKKEAFLFWQGRYAWAQATNPNLYYGTYTTGGSGQPLMTDVSGMELPVEPTLAQNRMAIPLAPLVEALGGTLEWNEAAQTANVTIPPPQDEQHMPMGQSMEQSLTQGANEPPREGYYKLLTLGDVLSRYENDDPFVLISFDENLPSSAMYEVLKAAADLRFKVYGLDLNKQDVAAGLPFFEDAGEVVVYFINGHERVKAVGDPDYFLAVDELINYMDE